MNALDELKRVRASLEKLRAREADLMSEVSRAVRQAGPRTRGRPAGSSVAGSVASRMREVLGRKGSLKATVLGDFVGVPRDQVYQVLYRLKRTGVVESDGNGKYRLPKKGKK